MVAKTKPLYSFFCLLMACLFGLSASFQLSDPDWFLWFPLYASGCVVNMVNALGTLQKIRLVAKFALWLGVFLFFKVVIEDLQNGIAGFWSLNMRERGVREMLGSGLVIGSMCLQLETPISRGQKTKISGHIEYGMAILVAISYGLSIIFYLRQRKEMKF